MIGLGTIVNCVAIIVGALIGMLIKNGLPKRFEETIFSAVGLAVMFIGLSGALGEMLTAGADGGLSSRYIMLMVISLVLGAVIGEALNIEKHLDSLGGRIKRHIPEKYAGATFVDGFVNASLLFCVGAMAIVGALDDGLTGDCSTLFAKAVLDGVTAILMAASLGVGVMVSAVPVLIYQGAITLLAQVVKPYLTDELISQMACVGSVLIFAIGINMIFGKKVKVGNLLPAILIPVFYFILHSIWPACPI